MLNLIVYPFRNMKFFNKVFLAYTLILVFAVLSLAQIISGNTAASSLERDIRYNKLVLYNTNLMIQQKQNVLLQYVKQAYRDALLNHDVLDFLEVDSEGDNLDFLEKRKLFIEFLASSFTIDNDILGITSYKKINGAGYFVSRRIMNNFTETSTDASNWKASSDEFSSKVSILPAEQPHYAAKNYVYAMSINLMNINTYHAVGALTLDFDVRGITKTIQRYYDEFIGSTMIFTLDGQVIYDSTEKYYGNGYPLFHLLHEGTYNLIIDNEACVVNVIKDSFMGTLTIGIIPKSKALLKIEKAKQTIYMISFLCIAGVLGLTYLSTKVFSRRIDSILSGFKKVRHGDLTSRIPLGASHDELYELGQSFNKMCSDLETYINRVYISEIKQKSAELTALQAQINPHFLYNTLEAIRMKANISGAREAGDMIYILSKFFRNSVKEDSLTYISEELENTKLYLELFKIRYGDILSFKFNIDPCILEYGIIMHVLQPVIENYMIHGFDSSNTQNMIEIKGFMDEDFIHICIQDNGRGIEKTKLREIQDRLCSFDIKNNRSIGLSNVHERIKIIFGTECGIQVQSERGSGTTVDITIKAKTVRELKKYV